MNEISAEEIIHTLKNATHNGIVMRLWLCVVFNVIKHNNTQNTRANADDDDNNDSE